MTADNISTLLVLVYSEYLFKLENRLQRLQHGLLKTEAVTLARDYKIFIVIYLYEPRCKHFI
jgi:hypothetical protein